MVLESYLVSSHSVTICWLLAATLTTDCAALNTYVTGQVAHTLAAL